MALAVNSKETISANTDLPKIWPLKFWRMDWWQQWFRVAKSTQNLAILGSRQIYIVPTRYGLLFALMLLGLLVGSINYSISLGYFITFLLTSLGHSAMLHTWRNLAHLQISVLGAQPVFAGDSAQISVNLFEPKNRDRYAIQAQFTDNNWQETDIAANSTQTISLPLIAAKRGLHTLQRLRLQTEFPMRLFHAWSLVENPYQVLVYPKPSDDLSAPPLSDIANSQGKSQSNRGDDDFDGHKTYQTGDAPSRVDWKASSRGIGLFTKVYSGNSANSVMLDWAHTDGLALEARISLMTRWLVDAHAAKLTYGVQLPTLTLAPSDTDAHYHQALTALALM
jgi:uncharacterized protein (DUF58 family)